jgi:hypothetical protein
LFSSILYLDVITRGNEWLSRVVLVIVKFTNDIGLHISGEDSRGRMGWKEYGKCRRKIHISVTQSNQDFVPGAENLPAKYHIENGVMLFYIP